MATTKEDEYKQTTNELQATKKLMDRLEQKKRKLDDEWQTQPVDITSPLLKRYNDELLQLITQTTKLNYRTAELSEQIQAEKMRIVKEDLTILQLQKIVLDYVNRITFLRSPDFNSDDTQPIYDLSLKADFLPFQKNIYKSTIDGENIYPTEIEELALDKLNIAWQVNDRDELDSD